MLHKSDKKNENEKTTVGDSKSEAVKQEVTKQELKDSKEITLKIEEFNKLKQAAQDVEDYRDRLLRLQAEFDNAKKRLEKEKLEFLKYAEERIIVELLGILDDLERSVEAAQDKHQDLNAFLKGIEMILAHLYEMLKKKGVSAIEVKGKKFDPNLHEAMMQIETDEFPEDTVVEELQKGYMLEDRIIRTAKVRVSKKPVTSDQ